MYEAYGEDFKTIKAAKEHVESLPYYAEAISKDGLLQTIWYGDGHAICSRQIVVEGIGSNRTVLVGNWFNY